MSLEGSTKKGVFYMVWYTKNQKREWKNRRESKSDIIFKPTRLFQDPTALKGDNEEEKYFEGSVNQLDRQYTSVNKRKKSIICGQKRMGGWIISMWIMLQYHIMPWWLKKNSLARSIRLTNFPNSSQRLIQPATASQVRLLRKRLHQHSTNSFQKGYSIQRFFVRMS